ncbi:diacylglycerol kinase family protein [Puia dinghuensis]|uniref:UDP kinase n=1 Tax=Puia dinghuensis TaxID=1792502 RepID=A0A8J2XVT1_9BACT|nr:diacylglycerol kinase family protein [Puia dinghuensis]GGB14136.1 UDP kinase [Puia dinghuensis]
MMQQEKFSVLSRIKSFSHAIAGIRQFILHEHNARIHLVATIGVITAGWLFQVTRLEAAALAAVTGLVWVAEIINTCIERLADLITRERRPEIKIIKDLAAGAVLTAAAIAVVAALFIFIPKFI